MIDLNKILQETDEYAKKRDALIGNTKSIADFMVAAKNFDSPAIILELVEQLEVHKAIAKAALMQNQKYEKEWHTMHAALMKIARLEPNFKGDVTDIARQALAFGRPI